jgi:hypothetical protein
MKNGLVLLALVVVAVSGWLVAEPAQAEEVITTTFEKGEVVEVIGNHLWARGVHKGKDGIHHFLVPKDFRFLVDGKEVSVHELHKGMRLTAVIIRHYAVGSKGYVTTEEYPAHVEQVKTTVAAAPAAPAPVAQAAPAQPVAPKLPKTAGPLPLIGLLGLGLLGTGAGIAALRRRSS